jgi:hypothetical protein
MAQFSSEPHLNKRPDYGSSLDPSSLADKDPRRFGASLADDVRLARA